MGNWAESGEGSLDYPAVSLVLVAHYNEPGTRIHIASQLLGQLLLKVLSALKHNEAGADLTPFGNQEWEQLL